MHLTLQRYHSLGLGACGLDPGMRVVNRAVNSVETWEKEITSGRGIEMLATEAKSSDMSARRSLTRQIDLMFFATSPVLHGTMF